MRQCDAGGGKDLAGAAWCGRADAEALGPLLDFGFNQAIEVAQHIGPFRDMAGGGHAVHQLLAQDQGQKRAEGMVSIMHRPIRPVANQSLR